VIDNFSRPCCEVFRPRKAGELPFELDKTMITTGLAKAKAAVIRCGEQHPAQGIVKIALVVGGDGQISSATVAESPDPALGECVVAAVNKVSFPKTENGKTFTYPFKF
jgi:TonB family protein